MCGIAGAVGTIDPVLVAAVATASERQRHRGPDDDGMWQSHADGQPGAVLGFRRLAIIDVSEGGHQPMVDTTTGNVIAFNGEIYNFRELRQELQRHGVQFASHSDTEVILKAYAQWGEGAIARLRGMFAIAIWDVARKVVLLARDRLGIKPLFCCTVASRGDRTAVLFASELRSLLATGLVDRRLEPTALGSYLWNGFVVGPGCMVAGVQQLPAGTMMRVSAAAGAGEVQRYWQLPVESSAPAVDAVARLREELQVAMRQHLVSDVPLGVFLSGGIDSSSVAALAAEQGPDGPRSVRTFNISFDEAAYDESRYALAVARAIGTDHVDVRLTQQHFLDHLDDALAAIDQPTFDGINTYFVSRAVREAGMTVALAGTGGDEVFGGYRSFVDVPQAARTAHNLRWLPDALLRRLSMWIARLRLGRFGEVPPQTRWGKLGDVLCSRGEVVNVYQVSCSLFTQDMHRSLQIKPSSGLRHGLELARAEELQALVRDSSPLHAVSTLELANFVGERLLRDTDWSSMAVSLEVRVPLLDHRVVEAAAAVDSNRRFQPLGVKQLLRDLALANVPPEIFERPKSGFVLPIEAWCRQRLRQEVADVFADSDLCASVGIDHDAVARIWRSFEAGAPGMYWSRIWALFVLLRWCREHDVKL